MDSSKNHDTFLYEAGHSTGHESRLNRDMTGIFGSEKYAKEELRAEIASAFTTQAIGLEGTMSQEHINNHKAYIQSWIAEIKNDPSELFKAINDATKISDYLIEKCNLKRFIREFAPEESIDETRDYDAMLEKLQKQSLKKIDDNPFVPEKVAGYGLPNHKNTEVHQQELRRTGHVRR